MDRRVCYVRDSHRWVAARPTHAFLVISALSPDYPTPFIQRAPPLNQTPPISDLAAIRALSPKCPSVILTYLSYRCHRGDPGGRF